MGIRTAESINVEVVCELWKKWLPRIRRGDYVRDEQCPLPEKRMVYGNGRRARGEHSYFPTFSSNLKFIERILLLVRPDAWENNTSQTLRCLPVHSMSFLTR